MLTSIVNAAGSPQRPARVRWNLLDPSMVRATLESAAELIVESRRTRAIAQASWKAARQTAA